MPNFLSAAKKPSDTMTQPKFPLSLVFMIFREVRYRKSVKGKVVQKRMKGETAKRKHARLPQGGTFCSPLIRRI